MSRVLEESNRIRFMHQGQVLRPGWSLHSCDVQNESILDFLVEQFGGGGMTFADVGNAGESSCMLHSMMHAALIRDSGQALCS